MATKKLVPRATNEGGLGTALKVWGPSWLQNLTITNLQSSTSNSVLVETAGNVEKRLASTFVPNLESLDEGVSLTTTTESINYVGAGVTTTASGNDTTVTIPGNCVLDTEDSTTFVGLWDTKTGCQDPKSDGGLRYDALSNILKVGSESSNHRVWIKSNLINKFLGTLTVKSQNGTLMLWGNSGKVGVQGFGGAVIATFYSNFGLRLHHLNTESAPVNILTEGVATGATTSPFSVPSSGFITKTPITSLIPNLQSFDEGVSLTATTQSLNFVGAGVAATVGSSNDVTVTITGSPSNVLDTNHNDCYVGLWEAATGALDPKTDTGLRYDATVGLLNVYTPGGGGTLRMGEVGNNTSRRIDAGWNTNGNHGATFEIAGNAVLPGSATNKSGGPIYLVAGAGTGSASASGGDSSIVLMGHKDTVSGTTAQTATIMAMHSIGSANNMKMPSIQSSSNDSFNVRVEAAKATLHTVNSSGSGPYNFPIHIEPRGDLILSTMDGGAGAKETYFKKNTTVQATVSSLRIESFMMACSDETTALTTGTGKVKFRMPYAFTVTEVRASLSTAGTGANLVTVDINESGTSILSTKITIDASESTSQTAATAPVISDTALADDAEISIDIDQIDSGGVSAGLKVTIIGHKTV